MPQKRIITGQRVTNDLFLRAKELRQAMTAAETRLWQRLRNSRLSGYHFRRQQIIDRFIVDFYCHKADLIVEVDGGVHLRNAAYDRARDEHLAERGLLVLRFTNTEVDQQLDTVLSAILEACKRRSSGNLLIEDQGQGDSIAK